MPAPTSKAREPLSWPILPSGPADSQTRVGAVTVVPVVIEQMSFPPAVMSLTPAEPFTTTVPATGASSSIVTAVAVSSLASSSELSAAAPSTRMFAGPVEPR